MRKSLKKSPATKRFLCKSGVLVTLVIKSGLLILLVSIMWPENTTSLNNSTHSTEKSSVNPGHLPEQVLHQHVNTPTYEAERLKLSEEDQSFADFLHARFGDYLQLPKARLQLLEKLIAYTREKLGEPTKSELEDAISLFLQAAFPDISDLLRRELLALLDYHDRINEEKHALALLNQQQRQAKIWQIREEFFGIGAKEIWYDQWQAQQFSEALFHINTSHYALEEKAAIFADAVKKYFGNDNPNLPTDKQQELLSQFLMISSVQQQLHRMDENDQFRELSAIRRQLGMNEAAVIRWQTLDKARSERRQKGQRYMQQRKQIEQEPLAKQEREKRLQALREELFLDEATIIADEEMRGYFRFAKPQVIGVN